MLASCCGALSAAAEQTAYSVAGLQPDKRPMAPKVVAVERDGHWYARAYSGIELPYPWTLRFINDQGNWHTPFAAPGMTGKYDLRGWHREVTNGTGISTQK
jgi:hypothetical protein